jgi:hypothetical protein
MPPTKLFLCQAYFIGLVPGGAVRGEAFSGTGTGTFTDHAADFTDFHFTPGTIGTAHLPGATTQGKPEKSQGAFELDDVEFSSGKKN